MRFTQCSFRSCWCTIIMIFVRKIAITGSVWLYTFIWEFQCWVELFRNPIFRCILQSEPFFLRSSTLCQECSVNSFISLGFSWGLCMTHFIPSWEWILIHWRKSKIFELNFIEKMCFVGGVERGGRLHSAQWTHTLPSSSHTPSPPPSPLLTPVTPLF